MSPSIRVASVASFMTIVTFAQVHAESTKVINRNVLRQMVQLSVAFTQARISFTSPPYPVQFVNTSPFGATGELRTASASGPIVNPNASVPNNSFLIQEASRLTPGNYNVSATTSSFTLTNLTTGQVATNPIPSTVVSSLPAASTAGSVSVKTTAGLINVTYSFRR